MYDAYSVKKNLNITPVSSMMNLYKDLTFGYQSEQDYTEVLKQVEKLSYVQEIIPFDKYVKGDLITYTFRVLFVNNQNISSDEINKYIKEVITLFEKSGFKLNP
jgi:phenylalanyl-tRNA synthetase beta subunit